MYILFDCWAIQDITMLGYLFLYESIAVVVCLYIKVFPINQFLALLHCFISLTVLLAGLLFNMCRAYSDLGLLVFMYLQCSLKRVSISLLICSIYASFHEWQIMSYIPLFYRILSVGLCVWVNCNILLRGLNAMCNCVHLMMLVIFLCVGLTYVKVNNLLLFLSSGGFCLF